MARPYMDDLNRQQWGLGQGSEFSYARLSTRSEVFIPYDDTVDDFYHKETFPLIDEQHGQQGRRFSIPLLPFIRHQFSDRRKRQMRWMVLLTFIFTSLTVYQVYLKPVYFPYIPPPKHFSINQDVVQSKCCSSAEERLTTRVEAIHAHQPFLDNDVLEQWVAHGEVHERANFINHVRIDGITTWVNGSDPRHHYNRMLYNKDQKKINEQPLIGKDGKLILENENDQDPGLRDRLQNGDNRFRDLNELRFSVRSARQSLQNYLGTHHIISTDFWSNKLPPEGVEDHLFGHHRGQVPQWLDTKSPLVAFHDDNDPNSHYDPTSTRFPIPAIRLHHDWQIFSPLQSDHSDIDEWRKERLPTFDSMAVEATVGINVPGLSQIYFLASDDMFTLTNMTTGDFYTPLFGPTYQIQTDWYMRGLEHPQLRLETTGYEVAVSLLRKRFGTPGFSYSAHVHKSMVHPLMVESRMMWKEAFEDATSKRFRGDGLIPNSHTLTYAMTIERHREALLWSYLVAKVDENGDGELSEKEIETMLSDLGTNRINSTIPVRVPKRRSNEEEYQTEVLKKAQFPQALSTRSTFTSYDGYAYAQPDFHYTRTTGQRFFDMPMSHIPPKNEEDSEKDKIFTTDFCKIDLLVCWPRDDHAKPLRSTNEIFKRFTFENRGCGDCLIMHLVGKSGERGLKAFLPNPNQRFPSKDSISQEYGPKQLTEAYHLPITNSYHLANFSLATVASENGIGFASTNPKSSLPSLPNLRTFAMHLITRYSYSIGTSTGAFEMLSTPLLSRMQLERIRTNQRHGRLSYLCLNDDISYSPVLVKLELNKFFEDVWPSTSERLPFEKPVWTPPGL